MSRSYYSKNIKEFLHEKEPFILGELTRNHQFSLDELQRNAWISEIKILKETFLDLYSGHILLEYTIPRMGKRVDAILLHRGIVFVIEFKVGDREYTSYAKDQVLDYAVDLKNFHEKSHYAKIAPVLVATEANNFSNAYDSYQDNVYKPILANKHTLRKIIEDLGAGSTDQINSDEWENCLYKPTPTIIEAAQALYRGHDIKEISRSDAGAINLSKTSMAINKIIDHSKQSGKKSICFITGVPGAGKTLAGLNLANERHRFIEEEHAVFLSGNGPLVDVLQEALARSEVINVRGNKTKTKIKALQEAKAFIQNIHHFRDDALSVETPPIEKVVVFDEAQRAWTMEQTSAFMQKKKGKSNFTMSEPEFLISIMDRHQEWAVIICLIGGGQEINTGEAGLPEWFTALRNHYRHWKIYVSDKITDDEYTRGNSLEKMFMGLDYDVLKELHLSTSIRSFRSENVSDLVKAILDNNIVLAKEIYKQLDRKYPICITRDFAKAKGWLRGIARGNERIGILASSGSSRLKPYGIYSQLKIDAKNWFLNDKDDVRSSFFLEDVATEFDVQGLELDWTCVAWDADLRYKAKDWEYRRFRGASWQKVNNRENIIYLRNAYRVLLTRARQGMVIFIPRGNDNDFTRQHSYYDDTYNYLRELGFHNL